MSSSHQHPPSQRSEQGFIGSVLLLLFVLTLVVFVLYAVYLNFIIVRKFENRKWDIPATLYSRPLAITTGSPLSTADLDSWLNLLHYSQGSTDNTGSYRKSGGTYTIHTREFNYGDNDIDKPQLIEIKIADNRVASLRSTAPNPNGIVRIEPVHIGGIYPENNEDRRLIAANQIPKPLLDALIATEDRSFYTHHGVSIRGIARAAVANITGKPMQGGSTITQQLVKNFYLNSDRTIKRKFNEALMALLLEMQYSKQEVVLAYMNEINLGQNGNRSVNGFGIASLFYFNKPLGELSLDQYALLVGIAKGPSYYNPRKYPERTLERRNIVLKNMLATGVIDDAAYQKAIARPLGVVDTPAIARPKFPDFLDAVQRELNQYYKAEDLQNKGLRIISTMDPLAQQAADSAMAVKLSALRKKGGALTDLQGALVSAHPSTGELVALVGSGSEFTGFNRAFDAKRQTGSLLKPVIYLTALQSGRYNLTTPVNDAQTTYRVSGQNWTPKNYGGTSHGSVPLINALANSYNQAAVNVGMTLGMNAFSAQMQNLSITTPIPPYPSTMLGAIELSPIQMLGMYQIFANGGAYTPIHSVRTVIAESGKVLQRGQSTQQFRAPPEAVYLLNRGLQEVMRSGTAKGHGLSSNLNLAGKTGTTNNSRDAWFAGYSGNYVSVAWVGRDDNKPIGLTGGSGALPIWANYMQRLNLTSVNLALPNGVTWQWMDSQTGILSHEACPGAVYLPVINVYQPRQTTECAYNIAYQAQMAAQYADGNYQGYAQPQLYHDYQRNQPPSAYTPDDYTDAPVTDYSEAQPETTGE